MKLSNRIIIASIFGVLAIAIKAQASDSHGLKVKQRGEPSGKEDVENALKDALADDDRNLLRSPLRCFAYPDTNLAESGELVTATYAIKNTGNRPAVIQRIDIDYFFDGENFGGFDGALPIGFCGPKATIAPGETYKCVDTFSISFDYPGERFTELMSARAKVGRKTVKCKGAYLVVGV